MLGRTVVDEVEAENGGREAGLSLLPVDTVFREEKELKQTEGKVGTLTGFFSPLFGAAVKGYEIHMGDSGMQDQLVAAGDHVLGTYLHGFFDSVEVRRKLLSILAERTGKKLLPAAMEDAFEKQEKELDRLADLLRESLDWELIHRIIGR
jgi:adenosylcobyric acid synthase